jgi:hypothetical protein
MTQKESPASYAGQRSIVSQSARLVNRQIVFAEKHRPPELMKKFLTQ